MIVGTFLLLGNRSGRSNPGLSLGHPVQRNGAKKRKRFKENSLEKKKKSN